MIGGFFVDAYRRPDGRLNVAIWQNIDDPDETPERRVMTEAEFREEFPEEVVPK